MYTEIFVPSYFGSAVLIKSEALTYDLFKSNWITAPKKYTDLMRILVERTLRPIAIFAEGIFVLNLTTLLKVNYFYWHSLFPKNNENTGADFRKILDF